MKHTLSAFEETIDSRIVSRGKDYFHKDKVQELEERENNVFIALVEGTEVYEVSITVEGNSISDHVCNCPYDMGEFCKHEVAVLYALRKYLGQEEGEEIIFEKKRNRTSSPKKRKTLIDTLAEGLEKLAPEEIKNAILDFAKQDRYFRNYMMRKCPIDEKNKGNLKKIYSDQIKKCIRSAADREGFVGYWECQHAVKAANELLESAQNLLQKHEYETVFTILQAEIESLYPALEEVDDSNGEFGGAIEETWEIFRKLCTILPKENPIREEIFSYLLLEMPKKEYDGWYAWEDFSDLATTLLTNEDEEKRLLDALDGVIAGKKKKPGMRSIVVTAAGPQDKEAEGMSDHEWESIIKIKRKIFEKRGKHALSLELRDQHLHFSDFREEKIQEMEKRGDYAEVKRLAQEGVQEAEKTEYRGNAKRFDEWLLKVAEKEKNIPEMRKYWRIFFLKNIDWEAYKKLKKSFSFPEEWKKEFHTLCLEKESPHESETILKMYEEEELWGEIEKRLEAQFLASQKNSYLLGNTLSLLEDWERVAKVHFPGKLLPWYSTLLRIYLEKNLGRDHYQRVCQTLRHIKKHLDGQEMVQDLKKEFSGKYKSRKALLDELGRV